MIKILSCYIFTLQYKIYLSINNYNFIKIYNRYEQAKR